MQPITTHASALRSPLITFRSQYALKSVYPASHTHIGQEFGAAVALDSSGALFVGAPNQLSSGQTERQNGAVHVLQLHSSPADVTSHPSTALNSLSPLSKPIGTSCASLLQQVIAARPLGISPPLPCPSHAFFTRLGLYCVRHIPHQAHCICGRSLSHLLRHAQTGRRVEHVLHK
jgi:hypothetical protein